MSLRDLAFCLVFFVVYFCSGKLSLGFAYLHQSASPVWAPTGIALAVLLLWGTRFWPAIWLGAFFVNLTTAGTVLTSFAIALGNTTEALLAAVLLQQFVKGPRSFERAWDIFKSTGLVAFATTISATFGATTLAASRFAEWADYGSIWMTWWLGDLAGAIVLTPVILFWSLEPRIRLEKNQRLEALGLFAVTVLIGLLIFSDLTFMGGRNYPTAFLCIPPLLWSAFRFGPRGSAASLLVLSVIAITGTIAGNGPFARQSQNEALLILQGFIGVVGIAKLAVAALVQQSKLTEQGLHDLTAQLNERVREGAETLIVKERELVRTNAEREQLDMFASLAAHDLQEPLRKITVFADLLKSERSASISDQGKQYLDRLQNAVRRMSELIRDLHHFSKIGAELEAPRRVDLNKVLKDLIFDLELPIKEARAEITVAALPTVRAGPIQARELFHNLIMNSLKFRKKGAPVQVQVAVKVSGADKVEITVQDNGIGFENEYARRIFKPFERLHGPGEYPGTGVGLAICQRIVERLGGKITAEGVPGEGATFSIVLPMEKEDGQT